MEFFTFLDYIIILVLVLFALEGYALGFVLAFVDLSSFVLSFVLGLKFYHRVGLLLVDNFSIPNGFADAIGFFIVAFISETILNLIIKRIYHSIFNKKEELDKKQKSENLAFKKINQLLGIFPGIISAIVLLSFLLTVVVALPFSSFLKHAVSSSKLGSQLVVRTFDLEKNLNDVFGGAVNEAINFFTIEPQSDEFVNLNFKTDNITIDEEAEKQMIALVNKEREKNNLRPLLPNQRLKEVARLHSVDMFKRGYFSHNTPEGLSPFDRMISGNISFSFAGENLALAPNVELAMKGLMNSPGHRANILSPNFGKIGVGVYDGGIYGQMFTQEFTD